MDQASREEVSDSLRSWGLVPAAFMASYVVAVLSRWYLDQER